MPDVSYTIYRRDDQDDGTERLVCLGAASAANPQAAVRSWFNIASPEGRAAASNSYLVVIPTRSHHELDPRVETQTRIAFS